MEPSGRPSGGFGVRLLGLPKVTLNGITLKGFPVILFSGARGVPLACFRNAFGALGAPFGCLWNALGVPKVHLNGFCRKDSPIPLGPSRSAQQLFDYFGRVNVDPTHPTVHCQPARFKNSKIVPWARPSSRYPTHPLVHCQPRLLHDFIILKSCHV